jgi:aminoacrylate hydrolase
MISAPSLVLVARDDILTPLNASEELARGIPGATLQVLPYGAHAASVCEPDAFNHAVLSFLLNKGIREELQMQQAVVG